MDCQSIIRLALRMIAIAMGVAANVLGILRTAILEYLGKLQILKFYPGI